MIGMNKSLMLPKLNKNIKQPAFKGELNIAENVVRHETKKHAEWYNEGQDGLKYHVEYCLPPDHKVRVTGEPPKKVRKKGSLDLKLTHTYINNGVSKIETYKPEANHDKFYNLKENFIRATSKQPYYINRKKQVEKLSYFFAQLKENSSIAQICTLLLNNYVPSDSFIFTKLQNKYLGLKYDLRGNDHDLPSPKLPKNNQHFNNTTHLFGSLIENVKKLPEGSQVTLTVVSGGPGYEDLQLTLKDANVKDKQPKVFTGMCMDENASKEEAMAIKLRSVCNKLKLHLTPEDKSQATQASKSQLTGTDSGKFNATVDGSLLKSAESRTPAAPADAEAGTPLYPPLGSAKSLPKELEDYTGQNAQYLRKILAIPEKDRTIEQRFALLKSSLLTGVKGYSPQGVSTQGAGVNSMSTWLPVGEQQETVFPLAAGQAGLSPVAAEAAQGVQAPAENSVAKSSGSTKASDDDEVDSQASADEDDEPGADTSNLEPANTGMTKCFTDAFGQCYEGARALSRQAQQGLGQGLLDFSKWIEPTKPKSE